MPETGLKQLLSGAMRGLAAASLARRLLVSQAVFLALTWLAMFAFLERHPPTMNGVFEGDHRAEAWLKIADEFRDDSERLQRVLGHIDEHQRQIANAEDFVLTRITMSVWLGDRLLYASPGAPGPMRPGPEGQIVEHVAEGRTWLSGTRTSDATGLSITLTRGRSVLQALLSLEGATEFLVALFLATPVLLVPAWLSVIYAARPLRRLGRQLAERGPEDLQPLAFKGHDLELTPLVDAMNHWLHRLRCSQDRENEFIANAAHELRTPLSALRIYAEGLSRQDPSEPTQTLSNGLMAATDRVSRMADQLLRVLRMDIDAQRLAELKPVDLGRFLQSQLTSVLPLADARSISVELQAPRSLWVLGRADLLESVIDNLVSNAIRHGPPRSSLRVCASATELGVRLTVEDAGPGIPPEWRQRVFERFRSVPGTSSTGAGLGLSIVHAAVKAMAGSITLDSSPELGGLRATVLLNATQQPRSD